MSNHTVPLRVVVLFACFLAVSLSLLTVAIPISRLGFPAITGLGNPRITNKDVKASLLSLFEGNNSKRYK